MDTGAQSRRPRSTVGRSERYTVSLRQPILPSLGRFLSVDPVAGGSANAYDYANGDPSNEVDLDGNSPKEAFDWGVHEGNWFYAYNGRSVPLRTGGSKAGLRRNDDDRETWYGITWRLALKWTIRTQPWEKDAGDPVLKNGGVQTFYYCFKLFGESRTLRVVVNFDPGWKYSHEADVYADEYMFGIISAGWYD